MALHLNVSVESFSKGRAVILGSEMVVSIVEPFWPRGVSFSEEGGGELRFARGARRVSCVKGRFHFRKVNLGPSLPGHVSFRGSDVFAQ